MQVNELKYWLRILHNKLSTQNRRYDISLLFSVVLVIGIVWTLKKIPVKGDNFVRVTARVKVLHNDFFRLYYLLDTAAYYSDNNSIETKITRSEDFQTIQFQLPDTLSIKQLRLDVGNNPAQKNLDIRNIVLNYNGKSQQLFNAVDGFNVFEYNEFMQSDEIGRYTLISNQAYDPFFYSSDISLLYSNLLKTKRSIPYLLIAMLLLVAAVWIYFVFFAKKRKMMPSFYSFASCLFILILLLPSLNEHFNFYTEANREKRQMTLKPALSSTGLLSFPAVFEKYYNDNFGLRGLLIDLGGKIKYNVFGTSFVPEKSAVGKDGWLYLNGKYYGITQDLTGENLYDQNEIKETIDAWEKRNELLKKDSIIYLHSFFPDKQYIYPEFMPFCMRVLDKNTIHRCDQALAYLNKINSGIHFVDVRPVLFAEKKNRLVYQKLDSHWNSYGAFLAYEELMKELSKEILGLNYHTINDYIISQEELANGDLSGMMGLKATETLPLFTLKENHTQTTEIIIEGYPKQTRVFENTAALTELTILMYRDSFTEALIPFLNQQFSKVVLIPNSPFSMADVKKAKPDIVVEAFAARYFK